MQPREVVRLWVEAFNRADVDAVANLYHEAAVNHQVTRSPVEGREAIRTMFAREFATAEMVCIPENDRLTFLRQHGLPIPNDG